MQFVRFSGELLRSGIEMHTIEGVPVPITNPARTVVDLFRYRQSAGRRYQKSPAHSGPRKAQGDAAAVQVLAGGDCPLCRGRWRVESRAALSGGDDRQCLRLCGTSARARLRNRAAERNQPFDLLLTRYVLERLLYRLGKSTHKDRFVLKGATLMTAWFDDPLRPTRDIHLLGFGDADPSFAPIRARASSRRNSTRWCCSVAPTAA